MRMNAFLIISLVIYFGDDKTKSILFASKQRANNFPNLKLDTKINYKTAITGYIFWVCVKSMEVPLLENFFHPNASNRHLFVQSQHWIHRSNL